MPISIPAARKPLTAGRIQLPSSPPPPVRATPQSEQQLNAKDDTTAEPPAGNE